MLITQLKAKETITSLTAGKKVFIINCHGCKEVRFPEKEAVELQKELAAEGNVTGVLTTDYICNPENMELRLKKHLSKIQEADLVLVFSCGVGVQTVAEYLEDKMVCAACDTYPVPGFQGVTPLEYKCDLESFPVLIRIYSFTYLRPHPCFHFEILPYQVSHKQIPVLLILQALLLFVP